MSESPIAAKKLSVPHSKPDMFVFEKARTPLPKTAGKPTAGGMPKTTGIQTTAGGANNSRKPTTGGINVRDASIGTVIMQ